MKIKILNRLKRLILTKMGLMLTCVFLFLLLVISIYFESFVNSALFVDYKKQRLDYSLKAEESDFGAMFKLPHHTAWLYFGSGERFGDSAQFYIPQNAAFTFLDGRSMVVKNNAYLTFNRDNANQLRINLKKGDLKIRPWSNTYERLIIHAKNEIFNISEAADFVELSLQDDELLVASYKRSGVVIKTEFVREEDIEKKIDIE